MLINANKIKNGETLTVYYIGLRYKGRYYTDGPLEIFVNWVKKTDGEYYLGTYHQATAFDNKKKAIANVRRSWIKRHGEYEGAEIVCKEVQIAVEDSEIGKL